jgi:hypothetical protein
VAAVFTDEEKVRIRHHLGYLGVQTASTFILGVPAAVQTSFILEGAMDRVIEAAAPQVRRHLTILDGLEAQMVDDAELMAVDQIGDIRVNQKEQMQLESKYDYWRRSLANLFGTVPNPYDQRFAGGNGVNVPVS